MGNRSAGNAARTYLAERKQNERSGRRKLYSKGTGRTSQTKNLPVAQGCRLELSGTGSTQRPFAGNAQGAGRRTKADDALPLRKFLTPINIFRNNRSENIFSDKPLFHSYRSFLVILCLFIPPSCSPSSPSCSGLFLSVIIGLFFFVSCLGLLFFVSCSGLFFFMSLPGLTRTSKRFPGRATLARG